MAMSPGAAHFPTGGGRNRRAPSAQRGEDRSFRPERRKTAASLELHPQTNARAVALAITPADPKIEPIEIAVDPKSILPAASHPELHRAKLSSARVKTN